MDSDLTILKKILKIPPCPFYHGELLWTLRHFNLICKFYKINCYEGVIFLLKLEDIFSEDVVVLQHIWLSTQNLADFWKWDFDLGKKLGLARLNSEYKLF